MTAVISFPQARLWSWSVGFLLLNFPLTLSLSLSLLPSVALSLEAKLQMLHTYMTVTWLPLPCEVKMKVHTSILSHVCSWEVFKAQALTTGFIFSYTSWFCPRRFCNDRQDKSQIEKKRIVNYFLQLTIKAGWEFQRLGFVTSQIEFWKKKRNPNLKCDYQVDAKVVGRFKVLQLLVVSVNYPHLL